MDFSDILLATCAALVCMFYAYVFGFTVLHNVVRRIRKHPHLKRVLHLGYATLAWLNHWRRGVQLNLDGIRYELDLSQRIDSALYFTGHYEGDATAKLKELVRDGDTVLDVGANIGAHTLLFSRLVGATGRVVAIEPMEWAIKKFQRNLELNPSLAERVTLDKLVVSDCSQESVAVRFQTSWPLFGAPTPIIEERVEQVSLDDYVARRGLILNFLKIDVDGFEMSVLRGAERTLRTQRPILMLEVGQYEHYNLRDVVLFLNSIGYDRLHWEQGFTPVDLAGLTEAVSKFQVLNLFCLPSSGPS